MSDKQIWVLTGGNGAGKSTYYDTFLASTALLFVNADNIAKKINPDKAQSVSYKAAIIAGKLRDQLLVNGESFCVETVFSHPSKIDFISDAKGLGYEVILVYIHLEVDDLNVARVAQRVAEGGHAVPEKKIRERIPRTMENIRKALPLCDRVIFYDNSTVDFPYIDIAQINNYLTIANENLPGWAESILADYL